MLQRLRGEIDECFDNLGVGRETRIADLADLIAGAAGFDGELLWDRSMPDGQPERRLDVTRMRDLTGFEAQVPLEEGIERTVAWWRGSR